MLHENIKKLMEGFQYTRPMAIFLSIVGAMSVSIPTPRTSSTKGRCRTHRLIAKVPSIAAWAYRHSIGRPVRLSDNDLSFTANFLNMLFKMTELKYQTNPILESARRPVHPARRSRAELLDHDDADDRQLACDPHCRSPAPRIYGRSTAARTRRCCGC
jgi:hypothetical protein